MSSIHEEKNKQDLIQYIKNLKKEQEQKKIKEKKEKNKGKIPVVFNDNLVDCKIHYNRGFIEIRYLNKLHQLTDHNNAFVMIETYNKCGDTYQFEGKNLAKRGNFGKKVKKYMDNHTDERFAILKSYFHEERKFGFIFLKVGNLICYVDIDEDYENIENVTVDFQFNTIDFFKKITMSQNHRTNPFSNGFNLEKLFDDDHINFYGAT